MVRCVMLGRGGEGVGDGDNIRRWVGYANNTGIALLFELVCWLGRRLGRYDNPAHGGFHLFKLFGTGLLAYLDVV